MAERLNNNNKNKTGMNSKSYWGRQGTHRKVTESVSRKDSVQLWGCREQDQIGAQTSTGMSHLQLSLFLGYSSHTQLPRGQCLNDLIRSHAPGGTGTLGDSPSFITGFNRWRGWLPLGKIWGVSPCRGGAGFSEDKVNKCPVYLKKKRQNTQPLPCVCVSYLWWHSL